LRIGLLIAGLAALGIAGGGALAEAPATLQLNLPAPATARISVPSTSQLTLLPDQTAVIDLSKSVHLRVAQESILANLQLASGFAPAENQPTLPLRVAAPQTTAAALEWDFSNWGGLELAGQNSTGASTLLGDFTPSPLSFSDQTKTAAAGISANVKFGDGWVTSFSYNVDTTQLDLKAGASPALASSSVHGQSFGLSIAKHGLFDDADALGLSVSRPSETYFGSISLADAGLETGVNLMNTYRGMSFNSTKETDIALGYVTTFFDGALALQANAGYQMNVGGQNGTNSLTVLSRAKINF
jgi:hypothetical protein